MIEFHDYLSRCKCTNIDIPKYIYKDIGRSYQFLSFFFNRIFFQLILKAVKETSCSNSKKTKFGKKKRAVVSKPLVHISEEGVENFKKLVTYVHTGRIDIHAHDVAGTSPLSLSLSLSLSLALALSLSLKFHIMLILDNVFSKF